MTTSPFLGGRYATNVSHHSESDTVISEETKPTENDIIAALAGELMSACIRVTNETEADIFCSWRGHIQQVDVEIYLKGWSRGERPDDEMEISFKWGLPVQELTDLIKRVEALGEVSA